MIADRAIVDASVVVRWFVSQPGHEAAATWLRRLAMDGDLLWAPDLLRFEVFLEDRADSSARNHQVPPG